MSSVTRYYRRTTIATQNGIGCPGNSNALTVLVNSVTSGTVSGAQTFCPGGSNPVPFTEMTAATGTGTLSYQWQSRLPFGSFSNIPGATNNTYDVPMVVTQDTYYSRVATSTVNGISCSATSNNVPIFINMVTGGTVAASQVICSGGNPAAFTQTLGSTYSGTVAYQWQSSGDNVSFNDISGATGITYDVPAGVTSTTYYKRVTRSTFNGVVCSATSNTLTITVNPLFGGVVGTDQSICQGSDPAAFTQISPSTGSGTLTYQWQSSLNGSSYSNIPSATNTVYDVPVGLTQTTYYRRITNATNGSLVCTTTSNNGIPLTVTVNPSTAITTHPSTTPQAVCQNGALTALMIAATGAGTLTYQWYSNTANSNTGGTLINGATSTSYTPSSTTTGTKYYYATATGSCGTATSSVSGAVTVKPFPSVYAYATNPTICSGSFTSMNAYGADSYSWSPATGLSATTGPSVIASPISTTTYTVTGTAINGCVNSSTVTVTVNSVVVSVNPLSPSKCHGSPAITLTASGALTYSWSPSTGLSATTGSIVTANPTATTTYTITGTNSNGCVGTVPVTVTVIPPISAVITPASSTTFCAGQSISVVLNANTGANLIYQWIKNGVNIPGATQSSYTASQVGLYQVTVTNTLAPCFITSLGVSVSVQTTGTILMNGDLCENGYTILSTKPGSGTFVVNWLNIEHNYSLRAWNVFCKLYISFWLRCLR
jgi:hypothetical protein